MILIALLLAHLLVYNRYDGREPKFYLFCTFSIDLGIGIVLYLFCLFIGYEFESVREGILNATTIACLCNLLKTIRTYTKVKRSNVNYPK